MSAHSWCVEKHWEVSATMDVSVRSPVLMRWWCTAPTASSVGIGGRWMSICATGEAVA